MKLREKIFKKDSENLFDCDIHYSEELVKGLYLVGDDSFIKRNVKALDIKYQVPKTNKEMGVKFSKQYGCVLLTIVMLDEILNKQKIQFVIKEDCTAESIYNCRHYILEGFRETLISGLQMLYATTLEDAIIWDSEHRQY
jgi:hypothetical protein